MAGMRWKGLKSQLSPGTLLKTKSCCGGNPHPSSCGSTGSIVSVGSRSCDLHSIDACVSMDIVSVVSVLGDLPSIDASDSMGLTGVNNTDLSDWLSLVSSGPV